jgi:hypothetical protein
VLGVLQLGFFLAGAAAGAAISFMIFSVAGNHFGEHANIIRYVCENDRKGGVDFASLIWAHEECKN